MVLLRHGLGALAAILAGPPALAALAVRPAWRIGLGERLGATPPPGPGSVWLHGASVGEILAATRLMDALAERGLPVFATTTTVAGREVVREVRPDIPSAIAPLDHPIAVARALGRVRPAALVLVETELWPFWIAEADRRGVPVLVVSGRLSDRSFPRYRRLRPILAPTLRRLSGVGARTPLDAERFAALGIPPERVRVTGDLKLEPHETPPAPAPDLAAALGETPLVVAGSTHSGEEEAALEALALAERDGAVATLALAPRRLERCDEVEALARARGRRVHRRTALSGARLQPGDVLLLDTLGELAGLYARARVAFVGGTLAPVGGHNLLEPVQVGCPVVFGPSLSNVRAIAGLLTEAAPDPDAPGPPGIRVADAAGLGRAISAALRDPAATRARGKSGRARLDEHRGSAARTAAFVEEILAAVGRIERAAS